MDDKYKSHTIKIEGSVTSPEIETGLLESMQITEFGLAGVRQEGSEVSFDPSIPLAEARRRDQERAAYFKANPGEAELRIDCFLKRKEIEIVADMLSGLAECKNLRTELLLALQGAQSSGSPFPFVT